MCRKQVLPGSVVRLLFRYTRTLRVQKPTYDPQIVVFADRWLDIGVVLRSGHTLQVAIVVQPDDQREDGNLAIQGGVHTQGLVPGALPARSANISSSSSSSSMHRFHSLEQLQQDRFILRVRRQGTVQFFHFSHRNHGGSSQLRDPQRKATCCQYRNTN